MLQIQRPEKDEYGKFYRGYIEKVGAGNIFEILEEQMNRTVSLIRGLTPDQAHYCYDADKWSVKEVIGHLIDSERVFAYRGLCFARGERQNLPGFDQDDYVEEAHFNDRSLESLKNEYLTVRTSTLLLFKGFDQQTFLRKGKASGYDCTVRAMLYIIAGHERHHQQILKEKYGLD